MTTSTKIMDLATAKRVRLSWKTTGEKVVFTNGCFDLLHLGHVDYLEKARNLGTKLILGINTDASIQRLKGEQRPILPLESRARVMASLDFVDMVIPFEEDTPLNLIETLCPDVLTKGQDYSLETIIGAPFVLKSGGSVETLELVEGYSTTRIIDKIKQFQLI